MRFLSPLLLWGLLGAAVPLVIHLVGRRLAPRIRFAALDFLLRSNRRLQRRLNVRQLVLLLVRMALAAGLAVMAARPFVLRPSDLPAVGQRPQAAVILLDDTLSMSRRSNGQTLLARAKSRARELLGLLGNTADLAVLSVVDPSGPLPILTRDPRRVARAVDSITQSQRYATVERALVQARAILAESGRDRRGIFVLGDLAAHGWPEGKPPRTEPGVDLQIIDVCDGETPANQAVVSLSASGSAAPGTRSVRIEAEICNYSESVHTIQTSLIVDDERTAEGGMRLDPRRCGTKHFEHAFARPGMHLARVTLGSDALPADDERHLLLEVEGAIQVLLVNGEPHTVRTKDELFYLLTALQASGQGGQPVRSQQVMPEELSQAHLEGKDMVVLANVRSLPQAAAKVLSAFVHRGGGLLITMGASVDAALLNHALGPLLPQELRGPLAASVPGVSSAGLRLGRIDSSHPIVAGLVGSSGTGLREARFSRVFLLRPATTTGRRVLASYDDGSPALVEVRRGEGRVLLFTSTLDRDWTDLPIRPGYAPLVQQMVRYLGRGSSEAPRRSLLVGQEAIVPLPAGLVQLRLAGPEGLETRYSAQALAGRKTLVVAPTAPGIYRLTFSGSDGQMRSVPGGSFAANLDPRESDLRRFTLVDEEQDRRPREKATYRVELWHALGALLLAFLVMEGLLLRR